MYSHLEHPPESEQEWFSALANLARFLRSPGGCPWDQKQTSQDFARYAAEEAEELTEASRSGDDGHTAEEFGDTFFTLMAMAAAAESEGRFTLKEALERAHEKMIRRHDHVFGETKAATPEDAVAMWNKIKEREKNQG